MKCDVKFTYVIVYLVLEHVGGAATNTIPDPLSFLGTQIRAFLWQDGAMRDLVADCRSALGISHPVHIDRDPAHQQAAARPRIGSTLNRSGASARTLGEAARRAECAQWVGAAAFPVLGDLQEDCVRGAVGAFRIVGLGHARKGKSNRTQLRYVIKFAADMDKAVKLAIAYFCRHCPSQRS